MAINYLKKKKMFAIMTDILGIEPKMIDTEYSFYRGTEWLRYSRDGFFYEICASNNGAWLTSRIKKYDYEEEKYIETWRKLHNGYGYCKYPIAEKVGV